MEVVHERCAGLDVSKRDVKVCVRSPGKRRGSYAKSVSTFGSVTAEILRLRDHLITANVTLVVMEATGDYWKPFYYLLEHAPFQLMLVNPTHARNIPGRKSDVSDAQWLAELAAHGLVRGSFVPPPPIRVLRDLTRARVTLTQDRVREINRLEKVLEDAGIKLSSVATDILGVSGRAMLAALIAGEDDAVALAELAKGRMRPKIPQLVAGVDRQFRRTHHAFLCRLHLERIDQLATTIEELSTRIEEQMRPFSHKLDQLQTIPGVARAVAEVIVAETGARHEPIPQSADTSPRGPGCVPATTNRRANVDQARPVTAIGGCAAPWAPPPWPRPEPATPPTSVPATDDSPPCLGKKKALVAVEHSILTAAWHMLTDDVDYHDLGGDYFARLDPERAMRRIVRQANALGYDRPLRPHRTTQLASEQAHATHANKQPLTASVAAPSVIFVSGLKTRHVPRGTRAAAASQLTN